MDALAPTAVPHSTKYIPVLDKHVVSKVFDEVKLLCYFGTDLKCITVLPLAHISNDKKQITLINPQAVNLDAYKEKLEQAVKSYEWRLNLITWRALSQEERDKFEQDKPVRYMEHKEALLESLENLGWPVSYEDVMLLEDEILAGLTYIQQASDLQEAAKKDIQRTSASPVNHSKKVGKECIRPQTKKGKVFETLKGQKVIARSDLTGLYFPGTVMKSISSTRALVDFSYGEMHIVPTKFIIIVGGAMPCPSLQVGDYVFSRTGIQMGDYYYAPAVVIATPNRVQPDDKLYTVLMYNNKKVSSFLKASIHCLGGAHIPCERWGAGGRTGARHASAGWGAGPPAKLAAPLLEVAGGTLPPPFSGITPWGTPPRRTQEAPLAHVSYLPYECPHNPCSSDSADKEYGNSSPIAWQMPLRIDKYHPQKTNLKLLQSFIASC
uniref:DUF4537 domain-containing protein n=1 Tax=Crocodylus porosus TaxID=8502 RepID=A0A7M4EYN7_CROPO